MSDNKWIACTEGMPDTDTTVMTFEPGSCEPIWPGYHDGEQWCDVMGDGKINVTHWMAFPDPPEV
jgi:hypothetical protein